MTSDTGGGSAAIPPMTDEHRWGEPISAERAAELDAQLRAWEAEGEQGHGTRRSPFDAAFTAREEDEVLRLRVNVFYLAARNLTGADVCYLAARARVGPDGDAATLAAAVALLRDFVDLSALHLEWANLHGAHLERAYLRGAHLEAADLDDAHLGEATLSEAHLEGAHLNLAHLEGANLYGATHLEQADLYGAHLERAILINAHLEAAYLASAHLERARLINAHLEAADLAGAHLEQADLALAHLERADLADAHLEGANLGGARLDEDTRLDGVRFGLGFLGDWLDRIRFRNRNAALGDVKWREVDVTAVPWERVRRLGDERATSLFADAGWWAFLSPAAHRTVVRAYRQVATLLRGQGMAEAADRFAYRAQIRQRGVLLRTLRLPQYLFSWMLFLLAGYGYRPIRTLFWYLVTIGGFAVMYMQATHGWVPFGLPTPSALAPLPWYEALILSVSSFHGRGFFQPLQSLGDPIAALAAMEAVIGLFIEISFIATFTQRYFGGAK